MNQWNSPIVVSLLGVLGAIEGALAFPVPLSDSWFLFDPDGNSSLGANTPTGFEATIAAAIGKNAVRPRVVQEFDAVDISQVGQSVSVSFDADSPNGVLRGMGTVFRVALYDTQSNYELIPIMAGTGPPSGSAHRMRIDDNVSSWDGTPPSVFIPGDYSDLGGAGGTYVSGGTYPNGRGVFEVPGEVSSISATVLRTSDTAFRMDLSWTIAGVNFSNSAVVNENPPDRADDIPPGGKWTRIDGIGFLINEDNPWNAIEKDPSLAPTSGTYRITNLQIEYTTPVHPNFEIIRSNSDIPAGEHTIAWNSLPGQQYTVWASSDLQTWTQLNGGVPVCSTGATTSFTETGIDFAGSGRRRYYQVRWSPNP